MPLSVQDRERYEEWRRKNNIPKFRSEDDQRKYHVHRRLYNLYAKPFEEEFRGQYIAIGFDGQTIIGENAGTVIREASEQMGRGNGVLARLGYETTYEWGG